MNEEKQPTFPDKYHLSRKESVYLLKKNIVELVYNAGKFEGLKRFCCKVLNLLSNKVE